MKKLNLNSNCTMKNLIDIEVEYLLQAERCHSAKDYKAEDLNQLQADAIEHTIVKAFGVSRQSVVEAVCETYDDRMKEQIEEQMNSDSYYFG